MSWETSNVADGPKVAAWMRRMCTPYIRGNESFRRRVDEWAKGDRATLGAIDNALTKHTPYHLQDLPDDVWLPSARWNEPHASTGANHCLCCGKEITSHTPSGKPRGPAAIAKAQFCDLGCHGKWRTMQHRKGLDPKACEGCGIEMEPRRNEGPAKFVKRRFCSRVCSGAANGRGFASGRMAA